MKLTSNRTFGIELEVVHSRHQDNTQPAADAVREAGYSCYTTTYTHADSHHDWKIATDSSLSMEGVEVVSPILKGEEGLEQITKVCRALTAKGYKVNKKCGCHVHVGTAGMSTPEKANVYRRYATFEEELDWMFAPSRREGEHADNYIASIKAYANRRELTNPTSLRSIYFLQRHQKLNLKTWENGHDTIEFRQHQGTVEAPKAVAWAAFCVGFVDSSIARMRPLPLPSIPVDITTQLRPIYGDKTSRTYMAAQALLSAPERGLTRNELKWLIGQDLTQISVILRSFQDRGLGLVTIRGMREDGSRKAYRLVPSTIPGPKPAVLAEDKWYDGLPDDVREFWVGRMIHFKTLAGIDDDTLRALARSNAPPKIGALQGLPTMERRRPRTPSELIAPLAIRVPGSFESRVNHSNVTDVEDLSGNGGQR